MSDWRAQMKGDPTGWLLEEDSPSVRYLALRHLLERPEDDPEVKAARAAIPRSRVVERIFARQDPGGFWGDSSSPYQPKYKSSYWTLMVLVHLGLGREDERVLRAVEHIFRFQQPKGTTQQMGDPKSPLGAEKTSASLTKGLFAAIM